MLAVGLFVGGLTAAYMTRAYYLTFEGEYRGHAHPHESPKVITVQYTISRLSLGRIVGTRAPALIRVA